MFIHFTIEKFTFIPFVFTATAGALRRMAFIFCRWIGRAPLS